MNTKIFAFLFFASLAHQAKHLQHIPLRIRLIVLPIMALVALISKYDRINTLPESHWLYKVPGFAWIARLLKQGMSIPFEERVMVLGLCFAAAWIAAVLPLP